MKIDEIDENLHEKFHLRAAGGPVFTSKMKTVSSSAANAKEMHPKWA